jgi:putative ABC transport system permease protein
MSDFLETITEAIHTLTVNKLRTALASLGIIIGIGSVIALVSLGQASQQAIQSQIQSLGANLLTVQPGGQNNGAIRGAAGGGTTLTMDDADAIKTSPQVNTVQTVSPEFQRRTQVTTGANNTNTQVVGVTPAYQSVHKVTLSSGNFISDRDVSGMSKVAVIGPQVATDLFGDSGNGIGQQMRVGTQTLTVIGITQSKGGTGFQNQDDIIYIPLTTAQKQIFGVNYLSSIALEAKNSQVMFDAQKPSLADFLNLIYSCNRLGF